MLTQHFRKRFYTHDGVIVNTILVLPTSCYNCGTKILIREIWEETNGENGEFSCRVCTFKWLIVWEENK